MCSKNVLCCFLQKQKEEGCSSAMLYVRYDDTLFRFKIFLILFRGGSEVVGIFSIAILFILKVTLIFFAVILSHFYVFITISLVFMNIF